MNIYHFQLQAHPIHKEKFPVDFSQSIGNFYDLVQLLQFIYRQNFSHF